MMMMIKDGLMMAPTKLTLLQSRDSFRFFEYKYHLLDLAFPLEWTLMYKYFKVFDLEMA